MAREFHNSGEQLPAAGRKGARTRILEAALVEFAEHGRAGARVDRIASRAGVNKAMIYYYFSSKAALHREIVDFCFSPVVARLGSALQQSAKLEDALAVFPETYIDQLSRRPEIRRLILHELAESESDLVMNLAEAIVDSGLPRQIVQVFQEKIARGEFREVDVAQTFVSFVLMNVGYVLLAPLIERVWNISDCETFLARRKQAVLDLFLYGVVKR
ncbi:MAG: TetR/AcrR family transcriptional regulator [Candidatus Zixiibacteriota bacterium]